VFSHLGYSNFVLPLEGQDKSDLVISLEPKTSQLDPATVLGMDGRAIVEIAMERVVSNYPTTKNNSFRILQRDC